MEKTFGCEPPRLANLEQTRFEPTCMFGSTRRYIFLPEMDKAIVSIRVSG
jgi:hypothetical protein